MNNTVITRQPKLEISTVEEKILLEKQLPFSTDKKGPTVDLYFHELTREKSEWQKLLRFSVSIIIGAFFLITLPIIALLIKIVSREPIFDRVAVPGRRGVIFHYYRYSTKDSQTQEYFGFGKFLEKTNIANLPSIINVWKGEMNLVGPRPYPAAWCNHWNKQLCDFYKRFAIKPGFINAADPITDYNDKENVADSLEGELRYVLNPSFKKDFQRLIGLH